MGEVGRRRQRVAIQGTPAGLVYGVCAACGLAGARGEGIVQEHTSVLMRFPGELNCLRTIQMLLQTIGP